MKGRPKRAIDAGLAARVRAFEQREGLSHRQASFRLGLEPSTYLRCMRVVAFSGKTAAILEQALDREGVPRVGPDIAQVPLHTILQILHIFEEGAAILAPFKGATAEKLAKSDERLKR